MIHQNSSEKKNHVSDHTMIQYAYTGKSRNSEKPKYYKGNYKMLYHKWRGEKAGSGVVVPGVWRVRTKRIEKGTLIWTPARKNPGQMWRRHSRQRDCKFVLECWNSLYIFVWFFWSLLAMNLTTVEVSFYDGGGRVSEVKRGLSRLKALSCQTKICHL